jgi:phage shock protein A
MFDRIKNLMGAMVNNGVNKLETPELLLEQAEMELQKNLKDLKEALTESIAGEKMTEIQLQKKAQELTDWEKRATIAVQHNNDEVATECLKKKQEVNEANQSLTAQLQQQKASSATLKQRYAEVDEKLREFLRKKPEMIARAKSSDSLAKAQELTSGTGGSSMDKWEEKIRAKEISVDPLGTGAIEDKFKALDAHSELDDELAALKAKVGVTKIELIVDKENVPLLTENKEEKGEAAEKAEKPEDGAK